MQQTLFSLPEPIAPSEGTYTVPDPESLLCFKLIPVIAALGKEYGAARDKDKQWQKVVETFIKKDVACDVSGYTITQTLLKCFGWIGDFTPEFIKEIVEYVESECVYIKLHSNKKRSLRNQLLPERYMNLLVCGAAVFYLQQKARINISHLHEVLVKSIPDSGPHLMQYRKISRFILNGAHDKYWYEQTSKDVEELFPGFEKAVIFDILAATSIRETIEGNTKKFLKALIQFFEERPRMVVIKQRDKKVMTESYFEGFLDATIINLNRIKNGKSLCDFVDETVKDKNEARKIKNFARAMNGDPDTVAADIWVMRSFGIDIRYPYKGRLVSRTPTPRLYDAIHCYLRMVGEYAGFETRQLSAMIWAGIRGENSTSTASQFGPLLKVLLDNGMFAAMHGKPMLENGKVNLRPLLSK